MISLSEHFRDGNTLVPLCLRLGELSSRKEDSRKEDSGERDSRSPVAPPHRALKHIAMGFPVLIQPLDSQNLAPKPDPPPPRTTHLTGQSPTMARDSPMRQFLS